MIFRGLLALICVAMVGCEYTEVERVIGYKGRARVNPWLAAERFAERNSYEVDSVISWKVPSEDDDVWFVPASVLTNEIHVRRMDAWVRQGGHLIVPLAATDAITSDWAKSFPEEEISRPFMAWVQEAGLEILEKDKFEISEVHFADRVFKVESSSPFAIDDDGDVGGFASVPLDAGRITLIADGRIFRNRWIANHDHAALLAELLFASDDGLQVCFMRGAGLSLSSLLKEFLIPVLAGMAAFLLIWLWKNIVRFGPMLSAEVTGELRGFGHHLDALGRYQWKLEHAASLLRPLREQITEFGHRACLSSGRHVDELNAFLAERSGISVERVTGVLSEPSPSDPHSFTRTVADLQQLLKSLNHPSIP